MWLVLAAPAVAPAAEKPVTVTAGETSTVVLARSNILARCTPPSTFHPNPTVWTIRPESVQLSGQPKGDPRDGATIKVKVPRGASVTSVFIAWTGNTACVSFNGTMTLKVVQPKPTGGTSRACATAELAKVSATSSAKLTEDLAKLAFLLQTGYTVNEVKEMLELLRQIGNALPTASELISHVDSHSTRAGEQGAWTKPTGSPAKQAADAQQQVNDVLNSPKREVRDYVPDQGTNKGKRVVEVSVPPSEGKPKGKAVRFVFEKGKVKFTLGVPSAPSFAKPKPRVSLAPFSGFTLLVAGGTATWSLTSSAVAAVNSTLCAAEKRKKP